MSKQGTLPATEDGSGDHSARAELSREMVRLYKDLFGRGPTKSRTDFAGPDIVVCTLEQSLTPAEQALAERAQHRGPA